MSDSMGAVVLLSVIGMAVVLYLITRRRADFLTFFGVYFIVLYVLAPLHLLLGGLEFLPSAYLHGYSRHGLGALATPLVVGVGFVCVTLGYHCTLARAAARRIRVAFTWTPRDMLVVAGILLGVGFASMYVYVQQYGGLEKAINVAILVRGGVWTEAGPLVFVKRFLLFSYVALFLVFAATVQEGLKPRPVVKLSLGALSCVGATLTVILFAARGNILYLLLVLYLALAIHKRKLYLSLVVVGGVGAVALVLWGKQLYHDVFYGEPLTGFISLLEDFSYNQAYRDLWRNFVHPYFSLEIALATTGDVAPRLFLDWIYALPSFVPERLFAIEPPQTIAYLNTELVRGVRDSIVPPGLFGFFWYSGLLPGVILGGVVYGAVGRWLDTVLRKSRESVLGIGVYCIVAIMWSRFTMTGEPRVFLFAELVWLIFLCWLAVSSRWYIQGRQCAGPGLLGPSRRGWRGP